MVVVQERPTIRTFDLKGNKIIKTEDMSKSLRNVGLASGKILNRYMLETCASTSSTSISRVALTCAST